MKRCIVLLAGMLAAACGSPEEVDSVGSKGWKTIDMSHGTMYRMDSTAGAGIAARPLDVWVPSSYDGSVPHNVLYMFDGQMLFDATTTWNKQEWGVDEVLDSLIEAGLVAPTIVVALHQSQARFMEYFPQTAFEAMPEQLRDSLTAAVAKGYGHELPKSPLSNAYLRYVVEEVAPLVASEFAVNEGPQHTAVMGSSMGGLMSMYAIGQRPDVFGTACCLSTHWPGGFSDQNNPVPSYFEAYLRQKVLPEGRRVYFDLGDQTLDALYPPYQEQMDAAMRESGWVRGINWETRHFPGAAHDEISWAARLHIPLQFAFGTES